jgi:hypothetical protein
MKINKSKIVKTVRYVAAGYGLVVAGAFGILLLLDGFDLLLTIGLITGVMTTIGASMAIIEEREVEEDV